MSLFLLSGGPFVRRAATGTEDRSPLPSCDAVADTVTPPAPAAAASRTLARGGFGQFGDTFRVPDRPSLPVPS